MTVQFTALLVHSHCVPLKSLQPEEKLPNHHRREGQTSTEAARSKTDPEGQSKQQDSTSSTTHNQTTRAPVKLPIRHTHECTYELQIDRNDSGSGASDLEGALRLFSSNNAVRPRAGISASSDGI